MDYIEIEKKWNKIWADTKLYSFNRKDVDNKQYVLEMFSYPSGAKLHVGHWYNFGLTDSYARFLRATGKNVFEPMGFDAFGLPAENYAIKTGVHPKDSTMHNIAVMEEQLKNIGAMFDWDYEIATCLPEYYRWTQWLFLQLYKKGLAYRKNAPVNWCPSCNTVLANEQVIDGKCERCDSTVVHKNLTQWFFKITDYAEELLSGLDTIDWPERTKIMQRNWIGKSTGVEVVFDMADGLNSFKVFTTRADTLLGCSYAVLAPEHPLVDVITTKEHKAEVEQYRLEASKANEIERLSTSKEKTGVFTGAYAINPLTKEEVPVWIGDYVLYSYGTGAIMGVAAHDDRDYIFAKKHDLRIKRVIRSCDGTNDDLPFCEHGVMVNSGEFDGLTTEQGIDAIAQKLQSLGKGNKVVNYRLRDWLVSRQRYWGAPIPVVYCPKCGTVPVPEDQLPVELPYDVNFTPDGTSPLARHSGFMHTHCPICGGEATRDPDTLDTFVCSSWYYLRYPDNKNSKEPFNKEWIDKMLPVDKYVGGPEHACMHLLYARFITKALRDMGYVGFDEPFKSLVHQGIILGPDGNRMSKSHGNVISPDEYINKYGSDTFRLYLAFGFKYIEGGPWNDDGIKAISKWLDRVEKLVSSANDSKNVKGKSTQSKDEELNFVKHNTIKAVTEDYPQFSFNTAVARMMELTNAMGKYNEGELNGELYFDTALTLLKLIAPLAPHFAEEMWEVCGQKYSIIDAGWPLVDESALHKSEVEIAVQVNSKVRMRLSVDASLSPAQVEQLVCSNGDVAKLLNGQTIKKIIVIPKRLVNIIV